jgi:hypothetical protein
MPRITVDVPISVEAGVRAETEVPLRARPP